VSVAVALNACVPSPKVSAPPARSAQVVEAMPDPRGSSVATQVMLTAWSTVYVPAFAAVGDPRRGRVGRDRPGRADLVAGLERPSVNCACEP
jgi:hypothetical protein